MKTRRIIVSAILAAALSCLTFAACAKRRGGVINVTSVTISTAGDVASVNVGETLGLYAEVLPADADQSVEWSISGEPLGCTVSAAGLFRAGESIGGVTVRATAGGVYGEKNITVTPAPVAAVAVEITFAGLNFIYDGQPKAVQYATNPAGVTLNVTYEGDLASGTVYAKTTAPPVAAGRYKVEASVNNAQYTGYKADFMTIGYGEWDKDEQYTPTVKPFAASQSGYGGDVSYVLNVSAPVVSVKKGSVTLNAGDYVLYGNNHLTLRAGYLASLPNGDHAFTAVLADTGTSSVALKKGDAIINAANKSDYFSDVPQTGLSASDAAVLSKYYILASDVDLSDVTDFYGIGKSAPDANGSKFTGVFDGNGYTVKNWSPAAFTARGVGFVTALNSDNAVIKNLGLQNIVITTGADANTVGVICGNLIRGTITDVFVKDCSVTSGADGSIALGVGTLYDQDEPTPRPAGLVKSIKNVLIFNGAISTSHTSVVPGGHGAALLTTTPTGCYWGTAVTNCFVEGYGAYEFIDESWNDPEEETLVAVTNSGAKPAAELKIGRTGIYASLSADVWELAAGQYPALKNAGANAKAAAVITLTEGDLTAVYDGAPKSVGASAFPDIAPVVTYNGSQTAPTNAGIYAVRAFVNTQTHYGEATGTLVISLASAIVSVTNNVQDYGSTGPVTVTVTAAPEYSGGYTVTYQNGAYPQSETPPALTGTYTVTVTLNNPNYAANQTSFTLTVQFSGEVTGIEITNAQTALGAGAETQLTAAIAPGGALQEFTSELVAPCYGVSIVTNNVIKIEPWAVDGSTFTVKVKSVSDTSVEDTKTFTVGNSVGRLITVTSPQGAAIELEQNLDFTVVYVLPASVNPASAVTLELSTDGTNPVAAITGVTVSGMRLGISKAIAADSVFRFRVKATDGAQTDYGVWITVTVLATTNEFEPDFAYTDAVLLYAAGQAGYDSAEFVADGLTYGIASVKKDGTAVPAASYTLFGHSNRVLFKTDYLNALPNGEHIFELVPESGASVSVTLKKGDAIISAANQADYFSAVASTGLSASDAARLSKYYILASDVDLSGVTNFYGIGKSALNQNGSMFTGVFDGNGYTVKNWSPNTFTARGVGFVAALNSDNAVIKNLGLQNIVITTGANAHTVGVICGNLIRGTITDVFVKDCSVTSGADGSIALGIGTIYDELSGSPVKIIQNVFIFNGTISTSHASVVPGDYGAALLVTAPPACYSPTAVTNCFAESYGAYELIDESWSDDAANLVTITNAWAKPAAELKIGSTGIYESMDESVWTFADGQYPALKNAGAKAAAAVSLTAADLTAVYDGTQKSVGVDASPVGLCRVTYDGSYDLPVSAGSYAVKALVNTTGYFGYAYGTLVISPAAATVSVTNNVQDYGSTGPVTVAVTAAPEYSGGYTVTYQNGAYPQSETPPALTGTYTVTVTLNNPNYAADRTSFTLTIQFTGAITGIEITNAQTALGANTETQLYAAVTPAQALQEFTSELVAPCYGVSIVTNNVIKIEPWAVDGSTFTVKVKSVSDTLVEDTKTFTVDNPGSRDITVTVPEGDTELQQGLVLYVEHSLPAVVNPNADISIELSTDGATPTATVSGITVSGMQIAADNEIAEGTDFYFRVKAADGAHADYSAWIKVTVTEGGSFVYHTPTAAISLYASGQTNYDGAAQYCVLGAMSQITSVSLGGQTVDPSSYQLEETASNKITFMTSYLNTLANGHHKFVVTTASHGSKVITLKKADIVIDGDNYEAYLTNGGASKLSVNNAAVLGKYYMLAADIDLSGKAFNGIGKYAVGSNSAAFTGVFDGNGHTISNWTSSDFNSQQCGFVGLLNGANAKVTNFVIDGANLTASKSKGNNTGILIGLFNAGSVENCIVKNSAIHNKDISTAIVIGGFATAAVKTVTSVLAFNNSYEDLTSGHTDSIAIGSFATFAAKELDVTLIDCYAEQITTSGASEFSAKFLSGTMTGNPAAASSGYGHKTAAELKIARAGIYESMDESVWTFAHGQYPALVKNFPLL